MARVRPLLVFVAAALTVSAGTAAAQQTRAPRNGEEIVVRTDTGGEVRGRLIELTPDSLAILAGAGRMDLPLARVARIDSMRDSVANGAAIGGLALGVWCAFVCGQGLDGDDSLALTVMMSAGLGAAIGAGIDAGHKGRTPIYIKPAGTRGSALQVRLRF